MSLEVAQKRVELLKELVPRMSKLALLSQTYPSNSLTFLLPLGARSTLLCSASRSLLQTLCWSSLME
jgi:hypothetical protein